MGKRRIWHAGRQDHNNLVVALVLYFPARARIIWRKDIAGSCTCVLLRMRGGGDASEARYLLHPGSEATARVGMKTCEAILYRRRVS